LRTAFRSVLGITIDASSSEVEETYEKRMGELRKRFDAERGMSMRAQCEREFAAIRVARDSSLAEPEIGVNEVTGDPRNPRLHKNYGLEHGRRSLAALSIR
jgi:hypothetical protein